MARQQEKQQLPIAPHYYWVQAEFARLRDKLEAAMKRPSRPMGLGIVDGPSALKIWEQSLRTTKRRLPVLLHSFSNTVLARSRRPSHVDRQRALIPLEQEVNRLIALHRQLWQYSFLPRYEQGQILLGKCIEKIATDLQDLFTFFIVTMEECAGGQGAGRSMYHCNKEINCRAEMAEYKSWSLEIFQPLSMTKTILFVPRLLHSLIPGVENRGSVLSDLMI